MRAIGSSSALPSITEASPGRTILLARHGRTDWTGTGRYQGRTDTPLNAEGLADAEALAADLAGAGVSLVLTSKLRRAVATAELVALSLGLAAPIRDERLAEIAFGAWEGRTQAEIRAEAPEVLRCWKRSPGTMRFPGGETLDEAASRLCAVIAGIDALPERGPILLVTHAGMIRLAILKAYGLPAQRFRDADVRPGSVHRFLLAGGRLLPAEVVASMVLEPP